MEIKYHQGSPEPDFILGWGGMDAIGGNGGNDTIVGGHGNDLIVGNRAGPAHNTSGEENIIFGGIGNDVMYAAEGVWGPGLATGSDTFVFRPQDGVDTVIGWWGDGRQGAYGLSEKIELRDFGDKTPTWSELKEVVREAPALYNLHGDLAEPGVMIDLTSFGGGVIFLRGIGVTVDQIGPEDFIGLSPERHVTTVEDETVVSETGADVFYHDGGQAWIAGFDPEDGDRVSMQDAKVAQVGKHLAFFQGDTPWSEEGAVWLGYTTWSQDVDYLV